MLSQIDATKRKGGGWKKRSKRGTELIWDEGQRRSQANKWGKGCPTALPLSISLSHKCHNVPVPLSFSSSFHHQRGRGEREYFSSSEMGGVVDGWKESSRQRAEGKGTSSELADGLIWLRHVKILKRYFFYIWSTKHRLIIKIITELVYKLRDESNQPK